MMPDWCDQGFLCHVSALHTQGWRVCAAPANSARRWKKARSPGRSTTKTPLGLRRPPRPTTYAMDPGGSTGARRGVKLLSSVPSMSSTTVRRPWCSGACHAAQPCQSQAQGSGEDRGCACISIQAQAKQPCSLHKWPPGSRHGWAKPLLHTVHAHLRWQQGRLLVLCRTHSADLRFLHAAHGCFIRQGA